MLRKRQHAVAAVASEFARAERSVETGTEQLAKCIATIIHQRAEAGLPLSTGADALTLMASALNDMLAARSKLFEAHVKLAQIPRELRMPPASYGDTGCPDDFFTGASHLSIVANH